MITAKSFGEDFTASMERRFYRSFVLRNTFLQVPAKRTGDYAQGYTAEDVPIRLKPDVLSTETYGVRTTADDLLRFVEANMGVFAPDEHWRRAIAATHVGYFASGRWSSILI